MTRWLTCQKCCKQRKFELMEGFYKKWRCLTCGKARKTIY